MLNTPASSDLVDLILTADIGTLPAGQRGTQAPQPTTVKLLLVMLHLAGPQRVTQDALAALLGVSNRTVAAAMAVLRRKGLVESEDFYRRGHAYRVNRSAVEALPRLSVREA